MGYGNREFYYTLFLRFNKSELENTLKCKLQEVELEKPYLGRKLDIYSTTYDGRAVIGEVQLSQSDNIHLSQLLTVIDMKDNVSNLVLFWVALEFKTELLDVIRDRINKSDKNIQFVALKLTEKVLHPEYIPHLTTLKTIDIVKNLDILKEINTHFRVKEFYYRMQNENTVDKRIDTAIFMDKLDEKEKILRCLMKEIRSEVYYLPTVYRSKKMDKYVIVLGAGINDASFFIGVDRNNVIYLELRFTPNTKQIFERIVKDKEKIDDMFNYLIEFNYDYYKLGSYFHIRERNRELVIKQVARMLHKYVMCFTEYTTNA